MSRGQSARRQWHRVRIVTRSVVVFHAILLCCVALGGCGTTSDAERGTNDSHVAAIEAGGSAEANSLSLAPATATISISGVRAFQHKPDCEGCRIVLEALASIGRSSEPVTPTQIGSDVARDSRGQFYTWSYDRFELLVYGASGTLLARFGRRGEGPGEISRPGTRLIIGAGDSLYAFTGSRYIIFDPQSRPVRTVQLLSSPFGAPVLFPDGRMVLAAPFQTPGTIGFGLHVLSASGEVLKSFGGDGTFDIRCAQCINYRVSRARNQNAVWVVPPNRYEIHRMDLDGGDLATLRIENSWFVPSTDSMKPHVPVTTIREDSAGLLWIFSILRPVLPPRQGRGVGSVPESTLERIASEARTIVDIVDPRRAVLVATQTA